MTTMALDDYAESMFRYERLHPGWIDACARYLRYIFGEAIEGKVFLDYAFGRGNWSLAALKAGAAAVVAVDAAANNVRRFSDYCRAQGVDRIDIVHGNILDAPIAGPFDVLWVYGILFCIEKPDQFIHSLFEHRRDDRTLALLHAYDSGSLRQVIVEAARRGIVYGSEQSFAEDSLLFTPRARLRARDDLTTPLIVWYAGADLANLATRNGGFVRRQVAEFREWMTDVRSQEFSPYHLLCGFSPGVELPVAEPERPQAADFMVLAGLAKTVMDRADSEQRRKLAIGLFNTHFSALPPDGAVEPAVVEDFLFLVYSALRLEIPTSAFKGATEHYYAAAKAAAADAPRGFSPSQLEGSPLARFLQANTLRF